MQKPSLTAWFLLCPHAIFYARRERRILKELLMFRVNPVITEYKNMNDTSSVSVASHPRRLSFDTLAIWALTSSVALAVLAFIPSDTIPFIYSKVTIVALGGLIALALYILARLTRGNIVVPPVPLLGAFWLVPLAYGLSSLFAGVGARSGVFGDSFETDTFAFMLILAVFATLAALTFRRSNQYRIFFKVATIMFALVVASQVLFIILGQITTKVSPTVNLIGSFADLGMIVGLGLILSLLALRFLRLPRNLERMLWIVNGFSLILLALVNSTLTWVLVSFVALGLFIEAILRRRVGAADEDFDGVAEFHTETESIMEGTTHGLAAPLITLVFALFFLIGSGTIGASLTKAFGAGYLDVRPSWQSTFAVGSHTYAASPLVGSGPGTFVQEWAKFREQSLNDTIFWNVDFNSGIGLIPTSAITTGLLGALAWLAFLGLFLVLGLRALLFRAPEEAFARYVAIASYVGAWYVFILALCTVPGPVVLIVGFFLAGLFVSSLRYGGSRREWGIIFSKNPRVGFVIVFALTITLLASVVAAYVVVERYLGNVAFAEANVALNKGDLETAQTAITRSILFAPTDKAYQLTSVIGIAQMNKVAADKSLSPSQAQQQFQAALSGSIQAATLATTLSPNNYQNWIALGNVYQTVAPLNIEGVYQNAKDAYAKAILLNPTSPTLPYTLAQLEILQKNAPAAEEQLIKAIGLKHDYTPAILLLSQLQVQEGKAKEALQTAEAAAYLAPKDPSVLFQVGILRSSIGDTDGAITALSSAVEENPQYANARFFLAVAYVQKRQNDKAREQLEAIAAFSAENKAAVAGYLALMDAGRNPFPDVKNQGGIPKTPVVDTVPTSSR